LKELLIQLLALGTSAAKTGLSSTTVSVHRIGGQILQQHIPHIKELLPHLLIVRTLVLAQRQSTTL
jgi:hypothetical protein